MRNSVKIQFFLEVVQLNTLSYTVFTYNLHSMWFALCTAKYYIFSFVLFLL